MAVVRILEASEEILAKYRRPGVVMMQARRPVPAHPVDDSTSSDDDSKPASSEIVSSEGASD